MRDQNKNSLKSTGKYLMLALGGIGCVILGFGQACSSGGGSGNSTLASNTETASSTDSTNSVSTLALTPSLQQASYSSSAPLKASGGAAPYTYQIISGGGTIDKATGLVTAPSHDATISIGVTDTKGTTAFALIVVSSTASATGSFSKEFNGTFSKLNLLVPGCSQAQPVGTDCTKAIRMSCSAAGYGAGFGPVELSGDNLTYLCILSGAIAEKSANFSALSFYQPLCTPTDALSDTCLNASNRYCRAFGYVGGFGPISYNSQSAVIDCMISTTDARLEIHFSELTALQSNCTDANTYSTACFSAARRYCKGQGYVSSFGITEHKGGTATVDCVR